MICQEFSLPDSANVFLPMAKMSGISNLLTFLQPAVIQRFMRNNLPKGVEQV